MKWSTVVRLAIGGSVVALVVASMSSVTAHGATPRAPVGWSALGSNGAGDGAFSAGNGVYAVAVSGTEIYAGGAFTNIGGDPAADYVARWDGTSWSALGSNGLGNGALNLTVYALAVSNGDLYAAGFFTDAAGLPNADYVARWDGSQWSALGSNPAGTNGAVETLVSTIAASGPDVYIGGYFQNVAGIPAADRIAKWNGTTWSALGSNGSGEGALNSTVASIAVAGGNVYAGGSFENVVGNPRADRVARWNGTSWSALGSDGGNDGALAAPVIEIAVSGSNVYLAGQFQDAAGIPAADYIARWDGAAWSALGSNGVHDGAVPGQITALSVSGSNVYIGCGCLDIAGIANADYVARWSGTAWSGLAMTGGGTPINADVVAISASPERVYVAGVFTNAAGIATADRLARWETGASPATRRPDGRIRLGAGPLVGNDVYNATGAGQARAGSAARGATVTFGISIQNDGTGAADRFKVKATGAASSLYTIRYLKGSTDITSAVVAGTYATPSVAPRAAVVITAKVTVKASATAGSSVSRLVTITSVAASTRKDAVKFTARRA